MTLTSMSIIIIFKHNYTLYMYMYAFMYMYNACTVYIMYMYTMKEDILVQSIFTKCFGQHNCGSNPQLLGFIHVEKFQNRKTLV